MSEFSGTYPFEGVMLDNSAFEHLGAVPVDVLPAVPLREFDLPDESEIDPSGTGWTPCQSELVAMMMEADEMLGRTTPSAVDWVQAQYMLNLASRITTASPQPGDNPHEQTVRTYTYIISKGKIA